MQPDNDIITKKYIFMIFGIVIVMQMMIIFLSSERKIQKWKEYNEYSSFIIYQHLPFRFNNLIEQQSRFLLFNRFASGLSITDVNASNSIMFIL